MSSNLIAILIVVPFLGCTKTQNEIPRDTLQGKWSEGQVAEKTETCHGKVIAEDRSIEVSKAKSYCRCVYLEIAERWDYTYFNTNVDACYDAIEKEGVPENCASAVGI